MKLYDTARAPNPRRVRIFLAEKGIQVPTEQVDIMGKMAKSDAFTALNPLQRVPVLELDDGTVITESVAICRYFEEIQPEPPLMGRNAVEKAQVEMWNRRVELGVFAAVANAFRHAHPAMSGLEVPQVKEWADANRPKALEAMKFLDRVLADRPFVAGELFSIADITLLCALDFARVPKIAIADEHVNLKRWHAQVSSRPSAKA
ncbi:glutathione S-transferase [Rhizobiales bacterium]|uniref:glutathione S-transferase family protein n=1 Tax=Hongsoonwoonella zoysiae TaxID=2821844 RepID=UPI001561501E|nr:glutathione S-transferase [Hongsoonwoonella zoysiae]NRG18335.1 glutathione S-transferase [Hongsoonwoonella zoysiae]